MPAIIRRSLQDIEEDKFHQLPTSVKGPFMINYAKALLAVDISPICTIFLVHLTSIFQSFGNNLNTCKLLSGIAKLRTSSVFLKDIQEGISSTAKLENPPHMRAFVQRILTQITENYFALQNKLMKKAESADTELVTDNDQQVIYYICGYLLHGLRKKFYKLMKSKRADYLRCVEHLISNENTSSVPSSWTDKMNRGGLKKPCPRFYNIFIQIEHWIRKLVSTKQLDANSLTNLQATLMDYQLLRRAWAKLFPSDPTTTEWTVLEHSISLFLKVRGFAVTKLVRKRIQLEQKKNKAKPGKRKALRKELKAMN